MLNIDSKMRPISRFSVLISHLPLLLTAALFSVVVALAFHSIQDRRTYYFEIIATSDTSGNAQLFYDLGHGGTEATSARASLAASATPQLLRFPLPSGSYQGLRYDPIEHTGKGSLGDALIRRWDGKVVLRFVMQDFIPENDINQHQIAGGRLEYVSKPAAADPIIAIKLRSPFQLKARSTEEDLISGALRAFGTFTILLGLVWLIRRQINRVRALGAWFTIHPRRAVALAAFCGVIASNYPIIFLGKSVVSPNFGASLLYAGYPTLPGYSDGQAFDNGGADVGALMWGHLPMAAVQSRALLQDYELPLWNRYNTCGAILLGQGQSIFGDPLHFLIILSHSAAWAWDLKYLIAKWLFATGIGLCVLKATRHLGGATILAGVMPFIGFFVYRINHPAIFSACYAPWILMCWLGLIASRHWRGTAMWSVGLIFANWSEMNSGTVKEAYMTMLTLNGTGAVILLISAQPLAERLRRFAIATVAGVIFTLLSAPVWLTFIDALTKSYTFYQKPQVFQIQPSLALGFFDEIFFRPYNNGGVLNGSVNFVVLLGLLAFLTNLRGICSADRVALALALATLAPVAIIFGVFPPQWIASVPFIANLQHTDNSFFCPTITLVAVLAGFGFRSAATRLGGPGGRGEIAIGGLLLTTLVAGYIAFGQTEQRSTYPVGRINDHLDYAPFVVVVFVTLVVGATGLAFTARYMLKRRSISASLVVLLATCAFLLMWRHGLHVRTPYSPYVVAAGPRVDFHVRSPGLAALKADQGDEPSRFAGVGDNAFPGWMNMYGIEGVNGVDPLLNRHYRELQEALGLEMMWGWRVYLRYETLPAQRRAFDFLNVRYYLARGNGEFGTMLSPLASLDLEVYRSHSAWPRAFFTDRVAVYPEVKAFGKLVNEGDGRPFAAMQADDETRPLSLISNLEGRVTISAKNYRLTSNTTGFEVEATGPGIAVLSESWLSGDFQAKLNGKTVPYLRINHAFKGIKIDSAGLHRIDFEYWPRRFNPSLFMAGIGALLLAVGLWLTLRLTHTS